MGIIGIGLILAYNFFPAPQITAEGLAAFFRKFDRELTLVYVVLFIARAFVLLPSTPFILAGAILFPGQPYKVLILSVGCIMASSILIYYFSGALGLDKLLNRKFPRQVADIRERLSHPAGFFFIVFWAFFPLVPTDALSYVAGTIRMNILKFAVGIFVGELILCVIYIFFGKAILAIF